MTSCSLLASSTNLHSLQTGYSGPPVTITVLSAHALSALEALRDALYKCTTTTTTTTTLAGVSSPPRNSLLPASFYLMMYVNLNINKTVILHQQLLLK